MSLRSVVVPGALWNSEVVHRAVTVSEVCYEARKCYYIFIKEYTINIE